MRQSAGVRDHLQVALQCERIVAYSNARVRRVQARLEPPILRRHAGRTRVGVAPQRLDAPNRKQKPTTDVHEVGAKSDMCRDVTARGNLARGNQGDVLRNPSRRSASSTAMSASTNGNPT